MTPNQEDVTKFLLINADLEKVVKALYQEVHFTTLDAGDIGNIFLYMGKEHAIEDNNDGKIAYRANFGLESDIKPQDIGMRLIKDQIGREMAGKMAPQKVKLLLDGLIGWRGYNPSPINIGQMDKAIELLLK